MCFSHRLQQKKKWRTQLSNHWLYVYCIKAVEWTRNDVSLPPLSVSSILDDSETKSWKQLCGTSGCVRLFIKSCQAWRKWPTLKGSWKGEREPQDSWTDATKLPYNTTHSMQLEWLAHHSQDRQPLQTHNSQRSHLFLPCHDPEGALHPEQKYHVPDLLPVLLN